MHDVHPPPQARRVRVPGRGVLHLQTPTGRGRPAGSPTSASSGPTGRRSRSSTRPTRSRTACGRSGPSSRSSTSASGSGTRRPSARAPSGFRTMADNIPQLAWMADGKGSIFWYNQRWFDYTGTTLEQMRGFGWKAVHDPDKVESVLGQVRRRRQGRDRVGGHVPAPRGRRPVPVVPLPGRPDQERRRQNRPLVRDQHRRQPPAGDRGPPLRQNEENLRVLKDEAESAKDSAEAARRQQEPRSWPT